MGILTRRANRTPGTSDTCEYINCNEPSAGEMAAHYYKDWNNGIPWAFCTTHIKPDAHPTDLHDKLVRWDSK